MLFGMDPKKIARKGEDLLEEAIIAVLAEAYISERLQYKKYLKNEEIGKRAGIYLDADWPWTNGIVGAITAKLEEKGRIVNGRWEKRPYGNTSYREDRWKLADPPVND